MSVGEEETSTTGNNIIMTSSLAAARIDEKFKHEGSGFRFHVRESLMLESHVADRLAEELGVHPHPCMLFDSFLKIYDENDRLILDMNTRDALSGLRLSDRVGRDLNNHFCSDEKENNINSKNKENVFDKNYMNMSSDSFDSASTRQRTRRSNLHASCAGAVSNVKCQYATTWGATRGTDSTVEEIQTLNVDTDWTFSTTYCPPIVQNNPAPSILICSSGKEYSVQPHGEQEVRPSTSSIPSGKVDQDENTMISFLTKEGSPHDEKYENIFVQKEDKNNLFPEDLLLYESKLPIERLSRQDDPILWFQAITLYEDELDDSGGNVLNVKIRVQNDFFFVLMRNEVRVDNVIVRRLDTRYFGEFSRRKVYREWSYTEATFEELLSRGDFIKEKPELILEAASMLRPTDLKRLTGRDFLI